MALDFEELRAFIAQNIDLKANLGDEEIDAIFFLDKPEEINADYFIVYSFYQVGHRRHVNQFMVQLMLCGKKISPLLELKDSLINLLNFYDRPCEIDEYNRFVFSNEGGLFLDKDTGYYIDNLYFDCYIL